MGIINKYKGGLIMNNKLTNRFNMIEAVNAYLSLYPDKVAESEDFQAALANLKQLAGDIRIKDNEKNGAVTGKQIKKMNAVEELTNQVMKIATALFLFGKKNNDAEITALAGFSRSDFKKHRDTEKVNAAVAIYNAANGKDLAFAKVTPEDITKLNELADKLKDDIADLSSGSSKRAAAVQSLDDMVTDALAILREELDKYMLQYSEEDQEFYNGYKSARVIWDTRARHPEEVPEEQTQG
jgi:hypothetical protein